MATRALYGDLDNVRLALATFSASGDVEQELRLATAAFWSLWTRASLRELRVWLDTALAQGAGADPALRADALGAAALAANNSGDSEGAREYARESLALARERDDKRQIEWALRVLSFDEPDLDERRRLLHECAQLCRELGNENGLGWVTTNLGISLFDKGKLDEAQETLARAARIFDGLGKPWEAAIAELWIGYTLIAAGRHADVRPLVERAITTAIDLDTASLLVESFVLLAAVSLDADPEAVPRLLRAAQALSDAGHLPLDERYGRPLFEKTQQAARERLGEQFEREWEAGALTAEEALELARRSS